MARVLLVDDDVDVRERIAGYMRGSGNTVVCTAGVAAAIRFIQQVSIDLVLLDLRPDGLDGLDVLAAVRRSPPPVVPRFIVMIDDGGGRPRRHRLARALCCGVAHFRPFPAAGSGNSSR